MTERRALTWLELTPSYRCNQRCLGCFAVSDSAAELQAPALTRALVQGRTDGATGLWLGGGEPSLRRDLFGILKRARALGYTRLKLQTNGAMLAYPRFVAQLVDAGLTEVAFSLKGATARSHDALTRAPGAFELLERGIDNARQAGLSLEGDVLLYRRNLPELPQLVTGFHARGLRRFRLWMLSQAASVEPEVSAEVPSFEELAPWLARVAALGLEGPDGLVTSLHTPACVLPEAAQSMVFFPRELGLRVVDASGHGFMLEESPMEGGVYLEGCEACALRPRCGGFRSDYLRLRGEPRRTPR